MPANGSHPAFDGDERLRVGEILAVREGADGPVLGCRECGTGYGPATDDPRAYAVIVEREIEELTPVNEFRAESDVILREYACPGCGTLFATDLQLRDEDPRMPEMHLKL
jgi:acetone carboxylase gamma subunit